MRFLILPALLLAPTPAAAEPLKPTAPWVVNYDDAQCVASRNYGTTERPFLLGFKPSAMGGVVRLLQVRPGQHQDGVQYRATVSFGRNPPVKTNALVYGDGTHKKKVTSINLAMADFERGLGERTLTVQVDNGTPQEFEVPNLANLRKVMADCLTNLQQTWNVSRDKWDLVATPAKSLRSFGSLFNSNDYPHQAIEEDASGTARVVMLIDEAGKVRDCTVEETSGIATLDTMSCYVYEKRAKFRPARGKDGKPIKSAIVTRIRWMMP